MRRRAPVVLAVLVGAWTAAIPAAVARSAATPDKPAPRQRLFAERGPRQVSAKVVTPCGDFVDVDVDDPFCPWIMAAQAAGRMSACASDPDPRFCPANAVTRQQLALALEAAAQQDVVVVNEDSDPVPVSVQGTTPVSLASLPPVASNDVTELILAERYEPTATPPCNGSVVCMTLSTPELDVSAYASIRVNGQILCGPPFNCTSTAREINVYAVNQNEDAGGTGFQLGDFLLVNNQTTSLSGTLLTPGLTIYVEAFCNPGPCGAFDLQIVGRRN